MGWRLYIFLTNRLQSADNLDAAVIYDAPLVASFKPANYEKFVDYVSRIGVLFAIRFCRSVPVRLPVPAFTIFDLSWAGECPGPTGFPSDR